MGVLHARIVPHRNQACHTTFARGTQMAALRALSAPRPSVRAGLPLHKVKGQRELLSVLNDCSWSEVSVEPDS